MRKYLLFALVLIALQANAQLGVMKLVGNNTSNYSLGISAYLKGGFPVSDGSDITAELGANIFFLNDGGSGDGTIVVPLKLGYRYTLNGTGTGFYVEPQVGYNLVGVTSLNVEGVTVNQHYHGAVFAAGTGYLFPVSQQLLDLNLRYETIMDDGGSTNYVSLGLSINISFKKREDNE